MQRLPFPGGMLDSTTNSIPVRVFGIPATRGGNLWGGRVLAGPHQTSRPVRVLHLRDSASLTLSGHSVSIGSIADFSGIATRLAG